MAMRGTIAATLGLALGLLGGRAEAQDLQWRPVAPAPAPVPQRGYAVRLQAPIADSTSPVRQASFYGAQSSDDGMVIRANGNQPTGQPMTTGQPMPIWPVLNDTEVGPTPGLLNQSP